MAAYATTAQLATYMGIADVGDLPVDATRLLTRASEVIDYHTLSRVDLTNDIHVEAVSRAACAQVEYWIENGEDLALKPSIRSKSTGRTTTTYAGPEGANPTVAPRARMALRTAGLLYRGGTAS